MGFFCWHGEDGYYDAIGCLTILYPFLTGGHKNATERQTPPDDRNPNHKAPQPIRLHLPLLSKEPRADAIRVGSRNLPVVDLGQHEMT
jgi:hypothetical protein